MRSSAFRYRQTPYELVRWDGAEAEHRGDHALAARLFRDAATLAPDADWRQDCIAWAETFEWRKDELRKMVAEAR